MIDTILGAIVPVLLTASLGYAWTRAGRSFDSAMLTLLVTDIGTPCLIVSTFAKTAIPPGAFAQSAAAAIVILLCFLVLGAAVLRIAGLRLRTYLPAMSFPNTGNLGLPLALYAFGPEGLSYAIVFFTFCSLSNFTLGQAIAAGTVNWRAIARMPIIYAVVIGVALSALQRPLPLWLGNTLSLLGGITVPLMLLLLGVSLGRLSVAAFPRAFALSILRIGMGVGVGAAITTLFGLEGVAKAALIQQSAMPVAVFNYLFALRWNNQPEEIAGVVVVSTLAAIVTAPALLFFLLR
ncbi:MAG TPA: AEC family transporter [Stellaceae bacterium]|jgi:predicted permease|nr:AEC family transporter [Stellaceae bacterium]